MLGKTILYSYLALPILLLVVFSIWSVVRQRRSTRWPISEKLLRPPGESLRIKLDQFTEQVFFRVCGVMLVWLICLLGMFKLAIMFTPSSWLAFYTILGIGVLLAAVGAWWLNRFFQSCANYSLGYFGERAVGEQLNQLMLDGCYIYHDFPADPKWNIDHIILATSGVYVVETKTRRKRKAQKGKQDHVIVFEGDSLIFPHDERSRYGLDQARNNAKWLSGFLSSATGEKVWVDPILTFPGWWIERRTKPADVQVFNPGEIPKYLKSRPDRLSAQSIERIRHQLDQKCRDVEF